VGLCVCVWVTLGVCVWACATGSHSARCKTTKQDILLLGLILFFPSIYYYYYYYFRIVRVQVFWSSYSIGTSTAAARMMRAAVTASSAVHWNLHTAVRVRGLPEGPPTFRDKSPLASEIKGTHIIVMYLPRPLCARLTVLVSKWNVVWNVISPPKRKIKIPLLGPLVSMGYYAVCARCIILFIYVYNASWHVVARCLTINKV